MSNIDNYLFDYSVERVPIDLEYMRKLEFFQPQLTYTMQFTNEFEKFRVAVCSFFNQLYNPFENESMPDFINLYLVDNQLEKELLKPELQHACSSYLLCSFWDDPKKIVSCASGVCLLTIEEMPDFVVHYSQLAHQRLQKLEQLQGVIHKIIEGHHNRDQLLTSLTGETATQLNNLLAEAELTKYAVDTRLSLYALNDIIETHLEYYNTQMVTFDIRQSIVETITEKDSQERYELEKNFSEVTYRACPVGVVFVHSGSIYNISNYYNVRKYHLNYLKGIVPISMIWAEEFGQESYTLIEEFSRYPLRNIYTNLISYEEELQYLVTGFAQEMSNFEQIDLIPAQGRLPLTSHRTAHGRNAITKDTQEYLSIYPPKNIARFHNVPLSLIVALTYALNDNNVVYIVANREQAVAQAEQIVTEFPHLKNLQERVAIVAENSFYHYPYLNNVAVISESVDLNSDLLAHARSGLIFQMETFEELETLHVPNYDHCTIVYAADITLNQLNAHQAVSREQPLSYEELLECNWDERTLRNLKFLRYGFTGNYRIVQRNIQLTKSNKIFGLDLSNLSYQSLLYFSKQERRNWNSQLSGDKFLTVRHNQREVSYYPNLSANQYVLAAFHKNLFGNFWAQVNHNSGFEQDWLSPEPIIYNHNINTGDLVTNISVAIHRIINYCSSRKEQISSHTRVNCVWVVADNDEELIPCYQKLFTNIFTKEQDAEVNIVTSATLDKFMLNHDLFNQRDLESKKLYVTLMRYVRMCYTALRRYGLENHDAEIMRTLNVEHGFDELVQNLNNYFSKHQDVVAELFPHNVAVIEEIINKVYPLFVSYQPNDALTNILILKQSDYQRYLIGAKSPDLVVFESSYDLLDRDEAFEFAHQVTSTVNLSTATNIILVSNPNPVNSNFFSGLRDFLQRSNDACDFRLGYSEDSHLNNIFDLPAAERFTYGIIFNEADFLTKDYFEPKFAEVQVRNVIKAYNANSATVFEQIDVQGYTLPLNGYVIPRGENPDYKVSNGEQLDLQHIREWGLNPLQEYDPALGERLHTIRLPYAQYTTSKVINTVISLLLAAKHTKSRGLLVTDNLTVIDFFTPYKEEGNFVIHTTKSLRTERAVFSHCVILADPFSPLKPAVVEHATLLTRGFKTPGSVFLIHTKKAFHECLGLLKRLTYFERKPLDFSANDNYLALDHAQTEYNTRVSIYPFASYQVSQYQLYDSPTVAPESDFSYRENDYAFSVEDPCLPYMYYRFDLGEKLFDLIKELPILEVPRFIGMFYSRNVETIMDLVFTSLVAGIIVDELEALAPEIIPALQSYIDQNTAEAELDSEITIVKVNGKPRYRYPNTLVENDLKEDVSTYQAYAQVMYHQELINWNTLPALGASYFYQQRKRYHDFMRM